MNRVLFIFIFFLNIYRIYQQSRAILQHLQYVLPARFGHMAGALLAAFLQGKETDRVIDEIRAGEGYRFAFSNRQLYVVQQENLISRIFRLDRSTVKHFWF